MRLCFDPFMLNTPWSPSDIQDRQLLKNGIILSPKMQFWDPKKFGEEAMSIFPSWKSNIYEYASKI